MKQFFKFTLASMLGFFVSGLLLIIVFFSFLFAAIDDAGSMFKQGGKVTVKENSILKMSLSTPVVDRSSNNPFENFEFGSGGFNPKQELSLKEVTDAIENAAVDTRIKGIFLDISSIPTDLANLEEIRIALEEFKSSGKFILSYSDRYDQRSYYLASVADTLYLNPQGDMDFRGLHAELAFFKGTLDKLDIEAQIIRGSNNKFKSAVEPFMYDKMSDANREQMTLLVDGLWDMMLDKYSGSRGISKDELNRIADKLLITTAQAALDNKLVDGLKYADEIKSELMAKVDVEKEDDLNLIDLKKYSKTKPKKASDGDDDEEEIEKPWEGKKERIAVIYASGEIRNGKSEPEVMGSETMAKAIREARKDSTVKAIVFRVNSPGGSALASEEIWREAQLAKEEKPFVVSMGRVAASGGYYISCGADKIYADQGTITGSIGVFGIIPNFKGMFNNKLGITFDGVQTNENTDIYSLTGPLTDYQYNQIQESVDHVYTTFKQRVAEGRGMSVNFVDSIGQGRVWIAEDAKRIGLVDEIGSLNDAVAYAIEQTGLEEDADIKSFPEQKDPFKELLKELSSSAKMWFIESELEEQAELYKAVQQVKSMRGIQARMPYVIEVH